MRKGAVPHQGVEDRERLPQARYQESPVELLEGVAEARGLERASVEHGPDGPLAAPHLPLAPQLAGAVVKGEQPIVPSCSRRAKLGPRKNRSATLIRAEVFRPKPTQNQYTRR
jgi:hypothetical protein